MSFAYAVVHGDTPDVYVAEDLDTLHRVLALEVVAATPGATFSVARREEIRFARLEERWGDAVVAWMEATDSVIDVFGGGLQVWSARRFAEREITGLEFQLRPLFSDTLL